MTRILVRARVVVREPDWYEFDGWQTRIELPNRHFHLDVIRHDSWVDEDTRNIAIELLGYKVVEVADELLATIARRDSTALLCSPEDLSPEYSDWAQNLLNDLSQAMRDAVAGFLWRHRVRAAPAPFELNLQRLSWVVLTKELQRTALDQIPWDGLPGSIIRLSLPKCDVLPLTAAAGRLCAQAIKDDDQSHVGHQLLREAWRLRHSAPRASVVIGVAGIETALKEFVARQQPQTEWLLAEMPSPPVYKLLGRYLPTLPSSSADGGQVGALPKKWRTTVTQWVEIRNRVAHGRATDIDDDEWEASLDVLFAILYFLDFHAGHEWAAGDADLVAAD